MDAGYSLLNPGSSLNFDVPAVAVIQGKEEEEEAAEDEKNKEKELQDLLTNAFDDLIEDDEFNSSLFSANKSQEGSFHDHKSSNQMLKNWLQDNKWIQKKNSEALSESSRKVEDSNDHERKSSMERYATSKDDMGSHAVQNGQNSFISMADGVDKVSGYAVHNVENDHYVNGRNWDANSQFQLREDGCYGAVGSEELTPSSDSRGSMSSYGCQSSPSNPEERQVNGNHDDGTGGQFYKPLDDFEYSQYQVQYVGEGLGQESQDWVKSNGNGEEGLESLNLQNQFMSAGMDGSSAEAVQLQILYRARGREIEKLQVELEQTKEEFSKDQKALKHHLSRMKVDNEGLTVALKDCCHSLEESSQTCAQMQGNIAALETRTQSLEKNKEELINKLQVAESTIETLNHQVEELECSETLARARTQHEMVVASMQQRHESETLMLKEKVDSLRNQLEEKIEEANNAKQQVNKLNRLLENAQLDRADTMNRLTKSLEESQRQCQDLLDAGTIKEACQLHLRAQTTASSSVDSEQHVQALQEEVTSLKEELEMLESACQLGLFPEHSVSPETTNQINIRKRLEFKTPQSSGNKRLANGDLVSTLKLELERSLICNKDKRSKLMKLHAEKQNAVKELDVTKAKLVDAELQISSLKAMSAELQAKVAEPQRLGSAQRRETEHLKKQRDHLTKELTTAHQQLAELEASEAKLTEANKRLSQQMAEMVKDCSEDRRQAVERCQQTYLQLHEDSIRKIRQEMSDIYQAETAGLNDALEKMAMELDSVKEMYVTVCEEKNGMEAQIGKLQDVHEADTTEVALQQQHLKVVSSLKEKNARLASSQVDQQNKNQEQVEATQLITSLTTQVSQLEAELVQHKTKVRELETSLILKVQELERLQQQHNLETQEYSAIIEELKIKLEDATRELEAKTQTCAQLQAAAEERSSDVRRLQEKYEQLVHDLTNNFVEEKLKLQKNEEELMSNITQLQTKVQERGVELQNLQAALDKELNSLQQQLEQALKDKESALDTQNALESGTKNHQDALQESIQQQLAMKEKLRRYHKYIQSREQQHQEILLKLQQEHGASLRDLTVQLEELKKATEASAEQRLLDMTSDHKNQMAKLEAQFKAEIDKQVQEIGDLKSKLQHYEAAYKQLQRDSSAENIAEIQENIKQVVHVLQRDIFQYVDGLNQRVAQRIQNEVLKERNSIIASLREQFGIQVPRERMTVVADNNSSAKHNVRSMSSNNCQVAIEKSKESEEKRALRKVNRDATHTDSGHHHHHHHHHPTVPKQSDAMAESLIALLPTLRELGKRIPELLCAGAGDDADQTKSPSLTLLSCAVENEDKHVHGHSSGAGEERSSGFESANTSSSYPSDVHHTRAAPSSAKGSSHSSLHHHAPYGADASCRKDGYKELTALSEEIKVPSVTNSVQYHIAIPTTTDSQVSINKPPVIVQKSPPYNKPSHRKVRRIASATSHTSVASQASLPGENTKTLEKTPSGNSLKMLREQPIGQSASDTGYNGKDKLSVGGMIQSTLNNLLTSVTDSLHAPDETFRNKNHLNIIDKSVYLRQTASKLQGDTYSAPGAEESIQFVFGSNSSILGNLAQPREYNPLPDHLRQATLVSSKASIVGDNLNKTFLPLLTESDNSLGDEYAPGGPEKKGPKISSSSLAQREIGSTQTGVWTQCPSVAASGN